MSNEQFNAGDIIALWPVFEDMFYIKARNLATFILLRLDDGSEHTLTLSNYDKIIIKNCFFLKEIYGERI